MDQAGIIYGTTMFGGAHRFGSVYRFVPATGALETLYSFCAQANCADGKWPYRVKLVIDAAGNLYGTASQGGAMPGDGGVVFELTAGGTYKILYTFCVEADCADGGVPATGLAYAGAASGAPYDGVSPLYGSTKFDGPNGRGVIFRLKPSAHDPQKWTYARLYAFCAQQDCPDGTFPSGPLTLDAHGNLFGTAELGGAHGLGVVYKLRPKRGGATFTLLHSFCGIEDCPDGMSPVGGVVFGADGELYGTTSAGGNFNNGLVFRLRPRAGRPSYRVLATFDGNNGSQPHNLIAGVNGDFFGTTTGGGANQKGVVFRFDGTIQPIYAFCPQRHCADGRNAFGALLQDGAGHLFGAAEQGGHGDSGTLYELSP